jgi:hypothetical protein
MYVRRAAESQVKNMLPFPLGKAQRLTNSVQYFCGWRAAASLFKPGIPGGANTGQMRDFFPPQPRRASACGVKSQLIGIQLCAA